MVRAAHGLAVREAFGHIERTAARVLRGHGGARVEPTDGWSPRRSDAGVARRDPEPKTRVLVANLGRGADGGRTAVGSRRLYAAAADVPDPLSWCARTRPAR